MILPDPALSKAFEIHLRQVCKIKTISMGFAIGMNRNVTYKVQECVNISPGINHQLTYNTVVHTKFL